MYSSDIFDVNGFVADNGLGIQIGRAEYFVWQ